MKKDQDIVEFLLKNIRVIIYIVIIAVLVFLNVRLFILLQGKNTNVEQNEVVFENTRLSDDEIDRRNDEARKNQLYSLGQQERIKRYLGEYIGFLKLKDYESAYNRLNESFKKNYFPTLKEYQDYIEMYYPKEIIIDYGTFKEEGELSVVEIILSDGSNSQYEEVTQRFVVRENDAMDYTISFQK